MPNSFLESSTHRDSVIYEGLDGLPFWYSILETHWGRIALLLLPRTSAEIYDKKGDTSFVDVIIEALEMAGRIGARTVSLTGLIPSATDYGNAINKAIIERSDLPQITTGHATTCATVVLAIKRILQESKRNITKERIGFLGLGSIGLSSLRLMLKILPHPSEILLCDIYHKQNVLEDIREEIINQLDFRGEIRIIASQNETAPAAIYESSLIVGATNVPNILDINKLKPGTMIVDDSSPHCFAPETAIQRFEEQADILFTEGGVTQSPHPIQETLHLPDYFKNKLRTKEVQNLLKRNPFEITGCIFSSLLSSLFKQLKPTVGLVEESQSVLYYKTLESLNFQAANLHCENYMLATDTITNFRNQFSLVNS